MRRATWIPAAFLAAAVFASELPSDWQSWRYSRPIVVPRDTDGQLLRVTLPLEVVGRARPSLDDLRVIDARGNEVPYVLHARVGSRSLDWRATQISDSGYVEGEYTQAVADAGSSGAVHNSVRIEIGEREFFTWIEVAASEDRETWRVVRERAPLFRFEREAIEGSRTISYPDSRARWLRLRLLGDEKLTVRAIDVGEEIVEEAELVALAARPRLVRDSTEGQSVLEVDVAQPNVPVSVVRCATDRVEFHRPVRIGTSSDGESWRDVAQGELYRYSGRLAAEIGDRERQRLEVRFDEQRGRYWRIAIVDRNDSPIEDLDCELLGTPRHVVFRPESEEGYRLLYGNHRAKQSTYDLARLTVREEREHAAAADLGAQSENAGYVSPDPWSERHPAVLWFAVALAVVVLGWIAVRSLGLSGMLRG